MIDLNTEICRLHRHVQHLEGCITDTERLIANLVERRDAPKSAPRLYLLSIAGDVEPALSEPLATERERVEAAQDYRRAHGDADGLFRLDIADDGTPTVSNFLASEVVPEWPSTKDARC